MHRPGLVASIDCWSDDRTHLRCSAGRSLKPSPSHLAVEQIRQTHRLKQLVRLECFDISQTDHVAQLTFRRSGVTGGEAAVAISLGSRPLLLELVSAVLAVWRQQGGPDPEILGVDEAELRQLEDQTGVRNAAAPDGDRDSDAEALPLAKAGRAASASLGRGRRDRTAAPREDRHIEALLAMIVGTGSTIGDYQTQLSTELAALEAREGVAWKNGRLWN